MVLWQGREVLPKNFRASVLVGDNPYSSIGVNCPDEYICGGLGNRVIKFISTPNVTIAAYTSDLFTPAADAAAVIVEFYRTPHLTTESLKLPPWIRRYLLKDYICMKAFKAEGPAQDLRAAAYYDSKMVQNREYLKKIKTNMFQAFTNTLMSEAHWRGGRPGRPVLPDNFPR